MVAPLPKFVDPAAAGHDALADADRNTDAEPQSTRPISALTYRLAVLRHYRPVYELAAGLLRGQAEAEDVTQEVFLEYWQRGSSVRRPREWMLTVARNRCMDRLRRSGRYISEEDASVPEPRDDRGPAWQYDQDALAERLERHIASLPEPQRSLVLLFDVQGLSGEECARVVGINVNQVKVYLHRARRRLRAKLETDE